MYAGNDDNSWEREVTAVSRVDGVQVLTKRAWFSVHLTLARVEIAIRTAQLTGAILNSTSRDAVTSSVVAWFNKVEQTVTSAFVMSPEAVVGGLRFCRNSSFSSIFSFPFSSATPRARWTELNQNRPHARNWVRFENTCPKSDFISFPQNPHVRRSSEKI